MTDGQQQLQVDLEQFVNDSLNEVFTDGPEPGELGEALHEHTNHEYQSGLEVVDYIRFLPKTQGNADRGCPYNRILKVLHLPHVIDTLPVNLKDANKLSSLTETQLQDLHGFLGTITHAHSALLNQLSCAVRNVKYVDPSANLSLPGES